MVIRILRSSSSSNSSSSIIKHSVIKSHLATVTLKDAIEYRTHPRKPQYLLYCLGIPKAAPMANNWSNALEDRFTFLLAHHYNTNVKEI